MWPLVRQLVGNDMVRGPDGVVLRSACVSGGPSIGVLQPSLASHDWLWLIVTGRGWLWWLRWDVTGFIGSRS